MFENVVHSLQYIILCGNLVYTA